MVIAPAMDKIQVMASLWSSGGRNVGTSRWIASNNAESYFTITGDGIIVAVVWGTGGIVSSAPPLIVLIRSLHLVERCILDHNNTSMDTDW
mmetsp:Transcript_24979/g.39229  ORF Transcript_24979/g.39229 Transcript_24979/m.39229 type:complete len:91 (+) Transcript_24979:1657-1929(+)